MAGYRGNSSEILAQERLKKLGLQGEMIAVLSSAIIGWAEDFDAEIVELEGIRIELRIGHADDVGRIIREWHVLGLHLVQNSSG